MFEEEFPAGELPDLPPSLIEQLHHRDYCYHHPYSESWDLANGMMEGLANFQE